MGDVTIAPSLYTVNEYKSGLLKSCFCSEVLMTSSGRTGSTEESRRGLYTLSARYSCYLLCHVIDCSLNDKNGQSRSIIIITIVFILAITN